MKGNQSMASEWKICFNESLRRFLCFNPRSPWKPSRLGFNHGLVTWLTFDKDVFVSWAELPGLTFASLKKPAKTCHTEWYFECIRGFFAELFTLNKVQDCTHGSPETQLGEVVWYGPTGRAAWSQFVIYGILIGDKYEPLEQCHPMTGSLWFVLKCLMVVVFHQVFSALPTLACWWGTLTHCGVAYPVASSAVESLWRIFVSYILAHHVLSSPVCSLLVDFITNGDLFQPPSSQLWLYGYNFCSTHNLLTIAKLICSPTTYPKKRSDFAHRPHLECRWKRKSIILQVRQRWRGKNEKTNDPPTWMSQEVSKWLVSGL